MVKQIFFDSGKVLVYPASGHWFYTAPYAVWCAERGLPQRDGRQDRNFRRAYRFLASRPLVADEAVEWDLFAEFYRLVFRGVAGKDGAELVRLCADSKVKDPGRYLFYPDVRAAVERLGARYRLGIISDAWPSLAGVYAAAGLADRFDPFIVSARYGCTKEGDKLFRIALAASGREAGECVFIDDADRNCRRARRLGFRAIRLDRDGNGRGDRRIPAVRDLAAVETLIAEFE
jgi:putative hydrolase of the HAD superfamily